MSYFTIPPYYQYCAASGVGIIVNYVIHEPFDTIKVRLQTTSDGEAGMKPFYKKTLNCFKTIVKNEGYLALYKSITPTIIYCEISYRLFDYGVALGRRIMEEYYGIHLKGHLPFWPSFFMGAVAGFLIAIFTVSSQRVKCLLQVETSAKHSLTDIFANSPWRVLKNLYNQGGISNIYHGFMATLLKEVLSAGIFGGVSEYLFRKLSPTSKSQYVMTFLILVVSNAVSLCFTYPLDVIKTRILASPKEKYPKGIQSVIKEIVKHKEISGLYRGFVPTISNLLLSSFTTFGIYYSFIPSSNF